MGIPLFKEDLNKDWENIQDKRELYECLYRSYQKQHKYVTSFRHPTQDAVDNLHRGYQELENLQNEIKYDEDSLNARCLHLDKRNKEKKAKKEKKEKEMKEKLEKTGRY